MVQNNKTIITLGPKWVFNVFWGNLLLLQWILITGVDWLRSSYRYLSAWCCSLLLFHWWCCWFATGGPGGSVGGALVWDTGGCRIETWHREGLLRWKHMPDQYAGHVLLWWPLKGQAGSGWSTDHDDIIKINCVFFSYSCCIMKCWLLSLLPTHFLVPFYVSGSDTFFSI